MVEAEKGTEISRVHVNRLKSFSDDIKESQLAIGGVFPDSKRIIRSILSDRKHNGIRQFKVNLSFDRGHHWINASDLPTVLVREFDEWNKTKASE